MLLCAPSLGILDNWLPVLHAVREQHPGWRIIALIPDRETLAQLAPDDTAQTLTDEVIDATMAPLVGGGWVQAGGLHAVAQLAGPSGAARAVLSLADAVARLLKREPFSARPEPHLLSPALHALRSRRQRRAETGPADLIGPSARLLYDTKLHDKKRLAPLMATLRDVPRHAMLHGIALIEDDGTLTPSPDPGREAAAYLFGPSEIPAYRDGFRVPAAHIHVVGVARHAPAWVDKVVAHSRHVHPTPFPEFVFVVSRPSGGSYLPPDRRTRLLAALHTVAWEEHGLPLVIRAHPKEHADGSLAAAFPAHGRGISWEISSAHPFHLAQHSRIGVVLFSGVAVDLVALGVPTIQLLDVAGLPDVDLTNAPLDAQGRPRFGPYTRDGLVHDADGADELREHLALARSDRAALLAPLREQYDARFARPEGASAAIVASLAADVGRVRRPQD